MPSKICLSGHFTSFTIDVSLKKPTVRAGDDFSPPDPTTLVCTHSKITTKILNFYILMIGKH